MLTMTFWKDALERAIKTGAQVTIPTAAAAVAAGSLGAVNWTSAGIIIGGSVFLSLLTSIVSSGVGTKGTASVVR